MNLSVADIANSVSGVAVGEGEKRIHGVAPFENATSNDITFAASGRYLKKVSGTEAGAIIVPNEFECPGKNLILTQNPPVAFAKVIGLFHPREKPAPAIADTARIGNNFDCGKDPAISSYVVIGENVTIGDRVVLHAHVFIGNGVSIGDDVEIFPNVTVLARCRIGNRVTIFPGTVIGSDGFRYTPDGEVHVKIPQVGIVQIDDDVEIGACNAIDRATFGKTWIQKGVKTDNLIQIGHNVTVGENSILVSQVGISGSVQIGKHVTIAGQAGIAGHYTIGDNVTIGPQAGISRNLKDGETVLGAPGLPHMQYMKTMKTVFKLPDLKKKLEALEKKVKELEAASR